MTKVSFNNFFPPEVKILFSDRSVDFAVDELHRELNNTQKKYLSEELSVPTKKIFALNQSHGNAVVTVGELKFDEPQRWPTGDAMVTNLPNTPITVRTADCLPIFIYDPKQRCAGIVHAGWKGSEQYIVANAVSTLKQNWNCRPENLLVAFGPAIRSCCYEVGAEFLQIFPDAVEVQVDKCFLDLAFVNSEQLVQQGVVEENIYDSRLCTCCQKDYYSYRRDGEKAGRHLSLMMFTP